MEEGLGGDLEVGGDRWRCKERGNRVRILLSPKLHFLLRLLFYPSCTSANAPYDGDNGKTTEPDTEACTEMYGERVRV